MTASTIAVLGGTGPEGRGLALRLAASGHEVVIGSRDPDRAAGVADGLAAALARRQGATMPRGAVNLAAAKAGSIVVVAVPYEAQAATLRAVAPELPGKILIDVCVALDRRAVATVSPPAAGSAAAEAAQIVGPDTRVVAAFHNVAAARLARLDDDVGCDVLVCGDDAGAKAVVLGLAKDVGLTAYDAGPLANAGVVEGLTAVLIGLNKGHGGRSAGIRITNLDPQDA